MQVPHGCVNVHGHIHNQASPPGHRHIDVTVGHLHYRPARLSGYPTPSPSLPTVKLSRFRRFEYVSSTLRGVSNDRVASPSAPQ